MGNINPIGLAQEKQRERDEKQSRILSHRFDTITARLDELEARIDKLENRKQNKQIMQDTDTNETA